MDTQHDTKENTLMQPLNLELRYSAPLEKGIEDCDGGVTTPLGFSAAGIHAGFRQNPTRRDFALVVADEPCAAAATFTTNAFCAPPVMVSKEHLERSAGMARAVMVNSGNANAATGGRGLDTARESARIAAKVLGCTPDEVLIASTGVIGVYLSLEPFERGLPTAVAALSRDGGTDAACAILTTDTCSKEACCRFSGEGIGYEGLSFNVGGMAKGSGMIMPHMATMISVLTTDAPLTQSALTTALRTAVNQSFNKVTVDSDTSTNDSCFVLASGAAAPHACPIEEGSPAYERFLAALVHVCSKLARQMAADGEGATRLVSVRVAGAYNEADADCAARAVANSPLVKTAIYGRDANWGRIVAALGKSGACFCQSDVSIDIMGLPVCRQGLAVSFDEDEALRRFEEAEITIDIDLGAGSAYTLVWTCDFSHDYITINGDYRT